MTHFENRDLRQGFLRVFDEFFGEFFGEFFDELFCEFFRAILL